MAAAVTGGISTLAAEIASLTGIETSEPTLRWKLGRTLTLPVATLDAVISEIPKKEIARDAGPLTAA